MLSMVKFFVVAPLIGAFFGGMMWSLFGIIDHDFITWRMFGMSLMFGMCAVETFAIVHAGLER